MKPLAGRGSKPAASSRLPSLPCMAVLALLVGAVTFFGHHMYESNKFSASVKDSEGRAQLSRFRLFQTANPAVHEEVETWNTAQRAAAGQYNHAEVQAIRGRGDVIDRPHIGLSTLPAAAKEAGGATTAPAAPGSPRPLQPTALAAVGGKPAGPGAPAAAPPERQQAASVDAARLALVHAHSASQPQQRSPRSFGRVNPRAAAATPSVSSWQQTAGPLNAVYSEYLANNFSTSGQYVSYSNHYGQQVTSGTVFVYDRSNATCALSRISFKYMPQCKSVGKNDVIQVLVLGIQRSGTHVIVGALKELGIDIRHEGVGLDGGCGWPFVSNIYDDPMKRHTPGNKKFILNNRNRQHRQRYRVVLHQVRHPLAVIRTLMVRAPRWDRFWDWIADQYFCSNINAHLSPPVKAMLLYLCWNEHIERQADFRYQIESTSVRDVCTWAGFPESRCNAVLGVNATVPVRSPLNYSAVAAGIAAAKRKQFQDADWPQYFYNTTWEMLEEADRGIAARVKQKCIEYHYPIELP